MIRFLSLLAEGIAVQTKIAEGALLAAALVIEKRAKANTRRGFKTGAFTTGGWRLIGHEIVGLGGAHPYAVVGSTLKHFAYWELGHHNIFTRRYERKEWLKPAFVDTQKEQQEAAETAATRIASRFAKRLR